jgi:heat shock protein beta-11
MPQLPLNVLLATSCDDRFPPTSVLDGDDRTLYLTTGMFPQEVLFNFGTDGIAHVNKVNIVAHGIKKMRIEHCKEEYATNFETAVDCELQAPTEGLQRESYQINKATVGHGVRYVRLVILEGYEPFAAIHSFSVDGDRA